MCRSTTHAEPCDAGAPPPGPLLKKLILVLGFAVAAYWVAACLTPVTSERVYIAWPPTVIVGWLVWRRPRTLDRRQRVALAIAGLVAGVVLALDFVVGVPALRPGEISRAAYCLAGFGLFMELLKCMLVKLLRPLVSDRALGKMYVRLPLRIAWILLFTAVAYPYLISYMQIHPLKRSDELGSHGMSSVSYVSVSWTSPDGTTLRGWFVPAGESDRAAIVCHGVMDTTSGMVGLILALHQARYNVLAFDMRGHGISDGWTVTYGARESADIIAAVDYLKSNHSAAARHVVGVGWSMGAASLILAAADDLRIEALHVDAPYSSTVDMARQIRSNIGGPLGWWAQHAGLAIGCLESGVNLFKLSVTQSAARISPRPIMIVHGTEDRVIPFEQGRKVFAASNEPKFFEEVKGAGHCESIVYQGNVYTERMITFLNSAIGS